MDYLFWRVSPELEDHQFAWILLYIWKKRNNKIFIILDTDSRYTLKMTETESLLWLRQKFHLHKRPMKLDS